MRVPPTDLSDAEVALCLAAGWGVQVREIAYAPIGFGSHHWHVDADAGRLFVTVDVHRDPGELEAAFRTAATLYDAGLDFVHAPLPSVDGRVLRTVAGRYPLVVHSWLEGTVLSESDDDRATETIGMLARLHDVAMTTTPARRTELTVQGRSGFESAMRRLEHPWPGPYGERARALLREHRDQLVELFAIHDHESAEMLEEQDDWVLTHGEPHSDNLIAGADGLHLIDWDTVRVAPAARDVWQVGGAREAAAYRELTGRALPQTQLEHFRRDWNLAEVCLYTADFAALHEETDDTRIMWGGFTESLEILLAERTQRAPRGPESHGHPALLCRRTSVTVLDQDIGDSPIGCWW